MTGPEPTYEDRIPRVGKYVGSSKAADYKVVVGEVSHGPDVQNAEESSPNDVGPHETMYAELLVRHPDGGWEHCLHIDCNDEATCFTAVTDYLKRRQVHFPDCDRVWYDRIDLRRERE